MQTQPLPQQPLLQPQSPKLPDFEVVKKFCLSIGEFKIFNNLDNFLVNGLGVPCAYKSKETHFTITIINNEKYIEVDKLPSCLHSRSVNMSY